MHDQRNYDEGFADDYEPSEEELKDMEKFLEEEENKELRLTPSPKNRLTYLFNSNSHFEGWLKVNGIVW